MVFWLTYLMMASARPEYSFMTKAISELGSIDAPNKWVWNVVGYIVPGLMIAVYAFGLYRDVSGGSGSKLPLVGLGLSGWFMAVSGVFPGDFDDRSSTTMLLHTMGSFGSYIFFLLAAFTFPKPMKKSAYWKSAVVPTLTFTWLTILFGTWPFGFTSVPAIGQRVVFFFYFLWIGYTALMLYRKPTST